MDLVFPFEQEDLKRSLSESDGGATANKNGVATSAAGASHASANAAASGAAANKRARPEKQLYRPPSTHQPTGQKNRRGGYQRY